jgi:hypothetical protein
MCCRWRTCANRDGGATNQRKCANGDSWTGLKGPTKWKNSQGKAAVENGLLIGECRNLEVNVARTTVEIFSEESSARLEKEPVPDFCRVHALESPGPRNMDRGYSRSGSDDRARNPGGL